MPKSKKESEKPKNGESAGLEVKLWAAADALRNNMDAAEYKHVVLGLIFLKYISDAFEAKHAERIFAPFQRLHGSEWEGNGIGLAIVQRILKRHGGEAWAESQPGAGASFFFTIETPGAPAPERAARADDAVPAIAAAPPTR